MEEEEEEEEDLYPTGHIVLYTSLSQDTVDIQTAALVVEGLAKTGDHTDLVQELQEVT